MTVVRRLHFLLVFFLALLLLGSFSPWARARWKSFQGARAFQQGKLLEAERDWELSLKLSPHQPALEGKLGSLELMGEPARGLAHLRRASQALPKNPEALYALAKGELLTGDLGRARRGYRKLLARPLPKLLREKVALDLALLALYTGNGEEAQKRLKRVRSLELARLVEYLKELLEAGWRKDAPDGKGVRKFVAEKFHSNGRAGTTFLERAKAWGIARLDNGRGSGFADWDRDGVLDLAVASVHQGLAFFRGGKAKFQEVKVGVQRKEDWGVVFFDANNDGWEDLLVTRGGMVSKREPLFLKNQRGTFVDATREVGLEALQNSLGGCVADYNRDGFLDLFIASGTMGSPSVSRLYLNRSGKSFHDVSEASGLGKIGAAFNCLFADLNNDGFPDLVVVRWGEPSLLFSNRGGHFVPGAPLPHGKTEGLFFGVLPLDVNQDGWLDLFFYGYPEVEEQGGVQIPRAIACTFRFEQCLREGGSSLLLLNRRGTFLDITPSSGLHGVFDAMGGAVGDLDNDGFEDLYLGTGGPPLSSLEPDLLFRNLGDGRFANVTASAGILQLGKGHGVTMADLNRDGFLDIYVPVGGQYPFDQWRNRLYLNQGNRNHWLEVELRGGVSNRDGVGARLVFKTAHRVFYQQALRGIGFASTSSPIHHQGLGKAKEVSLTIFWPSGMVQKLPHLRADQYLFVEEPTMH